LTNDEALVAGLSEDYRAVDLERPERVMLDFAAKLTQRPQAMQRQDIQELRGQGFSDRAIHDIVVVTAYYAFVNRVADGLGVELEPGWGATDA